jgi:hypothetical protein
MTRYDILGDAVATIAAEPDDDNRLPVHGVLFGTGDITSGMTGKRTRWPAAVLERAAEDDLFVGKPITLAASSDPEQHVGVELTDDGPRLTGAVSMDEKVGEITATAFDPEMGLLFEGFIADWEAEEAVESGLAQVSPVVMREVDLVEGEEGDPDALYEVAEIHGVRDVAIVADGAVPSNDISVGPSPEMDAEMAEALSAHFDTDVGVSVLQRERARRPSFSDTEDSEWSTPTLADYLNGYETLPDPDSVNSVDDLSDEGRALIARKSLLGTPSAETLRELRFFPVVDPATDALNRRALGAVRSGRGSQADIPDDAEASAERMAGELLNEEFDADIDIEANATHPRGDDGSLDGQGQSTSVSTGLPNMDDLTDKEKELVAAARQKDDPTVVEAEVRERLTELEAQIDEHEDVLDEAADLDEPEVMDAETAEAMQERIATVETMMAEALTDRKGLREATVEAMSFDAMAAEFETDDGLDVEALTQSPETGSGPTGGGSSGPTEEDVERIAEIQTKLETVGSTLPDSRVEALRQEAADLAGADDYEGAVEVL